MFSSVLKGYDVFFRPEIDVVFGNILTGCDVCFADLNLIQCLATF